MPILLLISTLNLALSAAADGGIDWIRVDHSRGPNARRPLVDSHGRQRVLRGVNIGIEAWRENDRPYDPQKYNGECPPNNVTPSYNQPPICGIDAGLGKYNQSVSFDSLNDLAEIRATGFNLIRLAISWSLLEPSPGNISETYIARIEQIVSWATEQDVWVVIDMHQVKCHDPFLQTAA